MKQVQHTIANGRVQLYKRDETRYWWAVTYLDSHRHRTSTGEESIVRAKEIAEDWYLGLRGKRAGGILTKEKTFADAAKQFTAEYELITEGERSEKWTQGHQIRLRLHLLPFSESSASRK